LQNFPFEPTRAPEFHQTSPKSEENPKEPLAEEIVPKSLYNYIIQKNDTLVGIALKFGIPVGELQRTNRLLNREIFHLKKLLVPVAEQNLHLFPNLDLTTNESAKQVLTHRFIERTHCSIEESTSYLERNSYNFESSLKEWKDKWETGQQPNNLSSVQVS
jgi:LysM repeat protein